MPQNKKEFNIWGSVSDVGPHIRSLTPEQRHKFIKDLDVTAYRICEVRACAFIEMEKIFSENEKKLEGILKNEAPKRKV